jgi:hypothetical protein
LLAGMRNYWDAKLTLTLLQQDAPSQFCTATMW